MLLVYIGVMFKNSALEDDYEYYYYYYDYDNLTDPRGGEDDFDAEWYYDGYGEQGAGKKRKKRSIGGGGKTKTGKVWLQEIKIMPVSMEKHCPAAC